MTTTIPAAALNTITSRNFFQSAGTVYVSNGDPDLTYPFFTSTDMQNWVGIGVFPATVTVDVAELFDGKIFIWDGANVAYSSNGGATWTETGTLGTSSAIAPLINVGGVLRGLRRSAGFPYLLTSSDGITINQTITDLPGAGQYWKLVTFNGVMYALPEAVSGTITRRIHTSADGVSWSSVGDDWSLGVRSYGYIEFGGRFYVVGGKSGSSTYSSDVHSTADMITWVTESYSSVFAERAQAASAVLDGVLYTFGGSTSGDLFDVWKLNATAAISGSPL